MWSDKCVASFAGIAIGMFLHVPSVWAERPASEVFNFDHDRDIQVEREKMWFQPLSDLIEQLDDEVAAVRDTATLLIYERLKETPDFRPVLTAIQSAHRDAIRRGQPEICWRLETIVALAPRETMSADWFDATIKDYLSETPAGQLMEELEAKVTLALAQIPSEDRDAFRANQVYIEQVRKSLLGTDPVEIPVEFLNDGSIFEAHRLLAGSRYRDVLGPHRVATDEQLGLVLAAMLRKVKIAERYLLSAGFKRSESYHYTVEREGKSWKLTPSLEGVVELHPWGDQFAHPLPISYIFSKRPVETRDGISGYLLPHGKSFEELPFQLNVSPVFVWDGETLKPRKVYVAIGALNGAAGFWQQWRVDAPSDTGKKFGFWTGMEKWIFSH